MSQVISVQEAAAILPELIKRVSDGEKVLIGDKGKAEVTLQATHKKNHSLDITIASEQSLAKDWLREEEDAAWANL